MATQEILQNIDLTKDYFQQVLKSHGFSLEARMLDGVDIQCVGTARSVAEMLRAMPLKNGHTPREVAEAKRTLLQRLESAQS
jgi:hypothetical protein